MLHDKVLYKFMSTLLYFETSTVAELQYTSNGSVAVYNTVQLINRLPMRKIAKCTSDQFTYFCFSHNWTF